MSRKSRNVVLFVMCFVLLFSAMACVIEDGQDALEGSPIEGIIGE